MPAGSRDARHPAADLRYPASAETEEEEIEYFNAEAEARMADLAPDRNAEPEYMEGLAGCRDIAAAVLTFPEPAYVWIETGYESLCLLEAYRHLAPVAGGTFMQIGGTGSHAVKMLLAGARRGFLLTPMMAEARYAVRLAEIFGVRDRFAPVLGLGEQIPFAADFFSLAFSFACFHHMRFEYLAGEMHRVLAEGGKFASIDPWKTLLHTVGRRTLGKHERSVHCRPVTAERLATLKRRFPDMAVSRHGPLLRYLCLGLRKLGMGGFLPRSLPAMMDIMRAADFLGRLTGLEGGVILMMGAKQERPT